MKYQERTRILPHEMHIKKNQDLQGMWKPSSLDSGLSMSLSSLMLWAQRGHDVYMGSGVIVELDLVVQAVTREQSTVTMAVVGPRKVITRLVGHEKLRVKSPESLHVVATAIAGIWKTIDMVAEHWIVIALMEAGNGTMVTVGPPTVTGILIGVK